MRLGPEGTALALAGVGAVGAYAWGRRYGRGGPISFEENGSDADMLGPALACSGMERVRMQADCLRTKWRVAVRAMLKDEFGADPDTFPVAAGVESEYLQNLLLLKQELQAHDTLPASLDRLHALCGWRNMTDTQDFVRTWVAVCAEILVSSLEQQLGETTATRESLWVTLPHKQNGKIVRFLRK